MQKKIKVIGGSYAGRIVPNNPGENRVALPMLDSIRDNYEFVGDKTENNSRTFDSEIYIKRALEMAGKTFTVFVISDMDQSQMFSELLRAYRP